MSNVATDGVPIVSSNAAPEVVEEAVRRALSSYTYEGIDEAPCIFSIEYCVRGRWFVWTETRYLSEAVEFVGMIVRDSAQVRVIDGVTCIPYLRVER